MSTWHGPKRRRRAGSNDPACGCCPEKKQPPHPCQGWKQIPVTFNDGNWTLTGGATISPSGLLIPGGGEATYDWSGQFPLDFFGILDWSAFQPSAPTTQPSFFEIETASGFSVRYDYSLPSADPPCSGEATISTTTSQGGQWDDFEIYTGSHDGRQAVIWLMEDQALLHGAQTTGGFVEVPGGPALWGDSLTIRCGPEVSVEFTAMRIDEVAADNNDNTCPAVATPPPTYTCADTDGTPHCIPGQETSHRNLEITPVGSWSINDWGGQVQIGCDNTDPLPYNTCDPAYYAWFCDYGDPEGSAETCILTHMNRAQQLCNSSCQVWGSQGICFQCDPPLTGGGYRDSDPCANPDRFDPCQGYTGESKLDNACLESRYGAGLNDPDIQAVDVGCFPYTFEVRSDSFWSQLPPGSGSLRILFQQQGASAREYYLYAFPLSSLPAGGDCRNWPSGVVATFIGCYDSTNQLLEPVPFGRQYNPPGSYTLNLV